MIISLIAFVLVAFGYEVEIRDNCGSLFSIEKGESVQEITPDIFSLLEWEEKSRQGFVAGEDSVFISLFSNAGNGAALVLFRKSESGYVFVDEFTSLFGGNGIEFSVSHPLELANGDLEFRLEWTAYCRGYYSIRGDESSFVSPLELSSFLILSTDGKNLHTEHDHR